MVLLRCKKWIPLHQMIVFYLKKEITAAVRYHQRNQASTDERRPLSLSKVVISANVLFRELMKYCGDEKWLKKNGVCFTTTCTLCYKQNDFEFFLLVSWCKLQCLLSYCIFFCSDSSGIFSRSTKNGPPRTVLLLDKEFLVDFFCIPPFPNNVKISTFTFVVNPI